MKLRIVRVNSLQVSCRLAKGSLVYRNQTCQTHNPYRVKTAIWTGMFNFVYKKSFYRVIDKIVDKTLKHTKRLLMYMHLSLELIEIK